MNFGYKSLIVSIVVCASWCKSNSQTMNDDMPKTNSEVVVSSKDSILSNGQNSCEINPVENQVINEDMNANNLGPDELNWMRTPEGIMIVDAWQHAMAEHGVLYSLTRDDIYALIELSRKDRTIGAMRSVVTDSKLAPEDLILMQPDKQSQKLSLAADAYCTGKMFSCYHYVKGTTMSEEPFVYMEGSHASEAIQWLDKNPNVVGVLVDFSDLDKVVEGSTVVFEKNQTPSGHIYTSVISNDSATYISPDGIKYVYNKKEESSDHRQKANLSGVRGRSGQRYGQPHAYIPKEVELGLRTFMNIVYKITKDESSKLVITPRDACEIADLIIENSEVVNEQLVDDAKSNFPTFKNAKMADNGYLYPAKTYVSKTYTAKNYKRRLNNRKYAQFRKRGGRNG